MQKQWNRLFQKKQFNKINNQGVTLVELIIAIVILGIVVTPLLHAFVTSAGINAKARNTFEETALAENLMEEFKDATVEDMIAKYGGVIAADGSGKVEFSGIKCFDLNQEFDDDVYLDITLNPVLYSSANSENLVDLETITASDSAIYSMPEDYDDGIYKDFADKSLSASTLDPTTYKYKDKDFFEKNLDRTIYVSIIKTGETTEGIPLVRVEMYLEYEWLGSERCLETKDCRFITETKELFDNSSTEMALNAIYIMFMPRYAAWELGHIDNIEIRNLSNVPTTVFAVKQETIGVATNYENDKAAHITVFENNPDPSYTVNTVSQIQLRTNMHEEWPLPTNSVSYPLSLECKVFYKNQSGSMNPTSAESQKVLNVCSLDGRTLDNSSVRNRIYEMKIELYNGEMVSSVLQKTEVLSTMSGTKIE